MSPNRYKIMIKANIPLDSLNSREEWEALKAKMEKALAECDVKVEIITSWEANVHPDPLTAPDDHVSE